MRTIKIFKRSILERTGYKKYPYKEAVQITILHAGREFKNHLEDIENPV